MERIYASPFRVYLVMGILAFAGIICGLKLPISLFPNSSKPRLWAGMPYGDSTAQEFLDTHGAELEEKIGAIQLEGGVEVDLVEATYYANNVTYDIEFKWGAPPDQAKSEVENILNTFAARLPSDIRDQVWVWPSNENSGFFAASFYSEERSLDSLYKLLDPILTPKVAKVKDAVFVDLWNPTGKEVRVELKPDAMASLQLLPKDIRHAIAAPLSSYGGGSVTVGTNRFQIQLPRQVKTLEELGAIAVPTPSGRTVHLSDIARIEFGPRSDRQRAFKTSGAPSLILFGSPKQGGNIKKMSEDIMAVVEAQSPKFPSDVKYKVLVDPSEFIRSSINNVLKEVGLAALIAVFVLFLFIGSIRNVVTAAIEIPLSMVLAFIMMRLFDMNLNLISLGGLALSAGMNVDASVVVMENIFRHFEKAAKNLTYQARLKIILQAVNEVKLPVVAATISSLVVFIPLAFTSELTYAILGDLAKAVVFSHGFSAFVALLLVPTIRLHLMSGGKESVMKSPIEGFLKKLEAFYGKTLHYFIQNGGLKWTTYGGLALVLVILISFVLPSLKREIIGRPDSDWITMNMNTRGNTLLRQMETQAAQAERVLLEEFGEEIDYTFNQIRNPNRATIMARLYDKSKMDEIWKGMEEKFSNTPLLTYRVKPWNPSELPIPDPPDMRLVLTGGEADIRSRDTESLFYALREADTFSRWKVEPSVGLERAIQLTPHIEQWEQLQIRGVRFSPADLSDMIRVATTGRRIGYLNVANDRLAIMARYPVGTVNSVEDIAAFPVGVDSRILPLKSLASVSMAKVQPRIYRLDGRSLSILEGRHNRGEGHKTAASIIDTEKAIEKWKTEHPDRGPNAPVISFEDPKVELNSALSQLAIAVTLSIGLIFLTLVFQFGRIIPCLLVLVSVPLGFIGVLISLFVFQSTLSLNSVLGVILLNGIAVANSIILVDFILRLHGEGLSPVEAAVQAAKTRLRPILITSLTTVLGMLPIALGQGDGGKILQPLGITVSGGLWVSMLLTLYLVPALQATYLRGAAKWMALRSRKGLVVEPVS